MANKINLKLKQCINSCWVKATATGSATLYSPHLITPQPTFRQQKPNTPRHLLQFDQRLTFLTGTCWYMRASGTDTGLIFQMNPLQLHTSIYRTPTLQRWLKFLIKKHSCSCQLGLVLLQYHSNKKQYDADFHITFISFLTGQKWAESRPAKTSL